MLKKQQWRKTVFLNEDYFCVCHCTALRRETTKDNDSQPKSSPKRFAVVSPKPQSPGELSTHHNAVRVCVWEFIFCQMPVKAVWICQGSILCGERYKNILYLPLSSPSLLQTFITLPLSAVAIATDHSNCDASTDSLPVSVTLLGHITAATVHQWLFSPVVKDQRDWSWAPGHVLRKESEWRGFKNQYLSEYITVVNRRGHIVHGQLPSQGQTTIHAHAFSICSVISVAETHTSTEENIKTRETPHQ